MSDENHRTRPINIYFELVVVQININKLTEKKSQMVFTASVVYRQVFTHNSYGYSSSIRLIADWEHLTSEAQQGGHPS